MRIDHRKNGFYVVDTPPGVNECGPYSKLSEAQECLEGIEQFLRNESRRRFFTVTPPTNKGEDHACN